MTENGVMPFIRQNLFLIVLAGITLVLVAGLLVVNSGVAGDIDEQTKIRADLAAKLGQLKAQALKKDLVNEATISDLKAHVQAVKELSAKMKSESEDWNKRYYHVYKYTVNDQKDKLIPAFPLDEAILKASTTSGIARQYVKERDDLINKLSTTWVPDESMIKDAIKAVEDRIKEDMPLTGDAAVEKTKPRGVVTPSGTPTPAAPVAADITAKATKDGTSQAVVKMSEVGLVYLNKDMAIGQVLSGTELNASHAELWEAQLQLWILSDIVAAIDQTNQQALSGQGGADVKSLAVPHAAIKQLVTLHIDPRYALGEGTDAGNAYGGGGGAQRSFNPAPEAPHASGAGADSGIKGEQSLTQRVSTSDYDVKHYTLTVVMATRYLKDFERYLMQRNYHTILNVSVKPLADLGADVNKFNFGSEPVMMVTITGELLLLSGWERALMPKDVLDEWVPKNLQH
jgi:hypothetical protein